MSVLLEWVLWHLSSASWLQVAQFHPAALISLGWVKKAVMWCAWGNLSACCPELSCEAGLLLAV